MIILALDTCFARCAALLFDAAAGKVLAEEEQVMERGHAEALAPQVARLFASSGLSPQDVDRVAVTTGPGTFTGLRIGLSFARAFGLARGLPVIGRDSLAAVALAIPPEERDWMVAHKAGQSGFHYVLRPGGEPQLQSTADVHAILKSFSGLLLGTSAAELIEAAGHPGLRREPARDLPQLNLLAAVAAGAEAPSTLPPPVYLREADAKPQVPPANTLRLAAPSDLAALALLHHAAFDKGWPEQELAAMLAVPGTMALLSEAGGQVAGFILTRSIAGEAEVLTLAVSPSLRRRGVGKAMVQEALAKLGQAGTRRLFLEVNETNAAARALYAAQGFGEQGRRKAYYDTPTGRQDAIVMARDLP